MYNILICGAAGDGIETMSFLLERMLKKSGFYVFTIRDAMSRVRGGQNFTQIRFSNQPIKAHRKMNDCIFFMNEEAFEIHENELKEEGFALCDAGVNVDNKKVIKLDLKACAKEIGNPKVFGTIGVGAILKLFSISLDDANEVLSKTLKSNILEANLTALEKGYEMVESKLTLPPVDMSKQMIITGNQALSFGALSADLGFYSAYPMSPSTTILETLEIYGEDLDVEVEQVEDEISAANMAIGASFAGARAMTGTSGGGFSLMVEALGFAGIAEIPIVMVDVQRPGPATGLPTRTEQSDLRFVISASQGEFPRMVIALRNHEDAFYQTARALELAEKYRIPVIILSDQYLADSSTTIPTLDVDGIYKSTPIEEATKDPNKNYLFTQSGISPRLVPGKDKGCVRADSDEHDEYGVITESATVRNKMVEKRARKLDLLKQELIEPDFLGDENFDNLIVGFGSTYGPIEEAIRILNKESDEKYGALIFGDIYPLPTKLLKKYSKQAKEIINIEQNATGQLASLLSEFEHMTCNRSVLKYDGRPLSVDDIISALKDEQ